MPFYGDPAPAPVILRALYNGSNDGTLYAIGAATATDGVWTRYGLNPVIQVGAGGTWDDATVKDPCIIWDGSQFVVYYAGYDGTKYQIGRATASVYSGPYTKAGGNPVLTVGSGGAFDDAGVNFPVVLYEPADTGKEWKMWYGADEGTDQSIGYAYSTNGTSWTKVGQKVTKGSAATWEDEDVLPMAIYKDGATYNLFYGGRQGTTNPKWQGGLVTFTDPEGVYTKDAGNPILLARFNDANSTVSLTGTTAASAIVTVTATSGLNVNEPVVLADGNSQTEVMRIASIDSGTQVTLTDATVGTFTVAEGAVLRSFAYNSVLPRTIRAISGGFEMFGTPFQPVEDLSVGGTKLREGSFRWTASALDGPWTYDYSTGLLFPLTAPGTTWDSIAAENPSVIVAP